jgi:hypothetical protein
VKVASSGLSPDNRVARYALPADTVQQLLQHYLALAVLALEENTLLVLD